MRSDVCAIHKKKCFKNVDIIENVSGSISTLLFYCYFMSVQLGLCNQCRQWC